MPTVTFMNLSKEKKDKIIKAAKKEFSRVPISEVLIKNIVEDAEIARGSFYQYFDSKEDLLKFLLEEEMEKVDEFAKQALKETSGDIFEVYIRMYDFLINQDLIKEDKIFHQKVLENVKTSEEDFYILKNLMGEELKGPFQKDEIISKVDKSKLKINNDNDLKIIIKILFIVTKKAIVSSFKYNSKEEARDEYIKMIEFLKYGIYIK